MRWANNTDKQKIITLSLAAIDRSVGHESSYGKRASTLIGNPDNEHYLVELIIGVLTALRDDIKAGHIESLTELLHGELF